MHGNLSRRSGKIIFMAHTHSFTSESVAAGHPDKVCDQISDAIVDAVLAQDPHARTAVEVVATTGRLIIAGEIRTTAKVDCVSIARREITRLGFTDPGQDFTNTAAIDVYLHEQSPEIAAGVDEDGAGDQGMMFGYACRETAELMPMPIMLAHQLARRMDAARTGGLPYLRPDGKSQITVKYDGDRPIAVEHVVMAVPHAETVTRDEVKSDLIRTILAPLLAEHGLPEVNAAQVIVNGTGVWHHGGPASDAGLTGRKIVVDGYGGFARVGGGAFSGKDPSKVDRSGAYAARFIAKNLVAYGLADRAEVGLAYCIGQPRPLWQEINTYGTATVSDEAIADFVAGLIDTSVRGIIERLDLRRPIYLATAAYGHFGRSEFPWEAIADKVAGVKSARVSAVVG